MIRVAATGDRARRWDDVTSRLASVGLVVVLLALSAFAIGITAVASRQGAAVAEAGDLSKAYQAARYELAVLEGLRGQLADATEVTADDETRYRAARREFGAAVESLLDLAERTDDAGSAEVVWTRSLAYLVAIDRRPVDGEPAPQEGRVDGLTRALQESLEEASLGQEARAQEALLELRGRQSTALRLTPAVFALGLALVLLAGGVLRRERRRADRWSRQHQHDAEHDALTGLGNRKVMARALGRLVDELGPTGRGAVLLLDLDAFKSINDTLGHAYGDEVLVEVARRLRELVPPDGTVVRLGGDEFAVVLADPARSDAELATLADGLARAVAAPILVGDARLHVTTSIGVARPDTATTDGSALLRRADLAMYAAKRAGQGVRFHDPALEDASVDRSVLVRELREALVDDRIEVALQPVRKVDGTPAAVEALARWTTVGRETLGPDRFLAVAEHSGLMSEVTRRVLDRALGAAVALRAQGVVVPVVVNLSAADLNDPDLGATVLAALERHGLPVEAVVVEASAQVLDGQGQPEQLGTLASLGIQVGMDRLDPTVSPALLARLPLTYVKLRAGPVADAGATRHRAAFAGAVALAHAMGLEVVASGVVDEATRDAVVAAGVDALQGHLVGGPGTLTALLDEVRATLPSG